MPSTVKTQEQLEHYRHERLPVGWRYLREGDTVEAGDLVFRKLDARCRLYSRYQIPTEGCVLGGSLRGKRVAYVVDRFGLVTTLRAIRRTV